MTEEKLAEIMESEMIADMEAEVIESKVAPEDATEIVINGKTYDEDELIIFLQHIKLNPMEDYMNANDDGVTCESLYVLDVTPDHALISMKTVGEDEFMYTSRWDTPNENFGLKELLEDYDVYLASKGERNLT